MMRNADLRCLIAQLRGLPEDQVSTGQMTYDLRRLRTHGLIERIPQTHRYHVTDTGLQTAMLLTRIHERLLPTALAQQLDPALDSGPLRTAARAYQTAIDKLSTQTGVAA
jgi:predicted MarR family transcription regulator